MNGEITPSLNELTFACMNTIRARSNSNDPISTRLIEFHIKNARAFLIRQDSNKSYVPDTNIVQRLVTDVIKVDSADSCVINSGCYTFRTKVKIPSIIETSHSQLLTRIGPVDLKSKPFSLIPIARVPFITFNRFNSNQIFAYLDNGYIFFISKSLILLKKVTVSAVFEDPELLANFACGSDKCYSKDSAFPIKHSMVNAIKDIVIKNYLALPSQAAQDLSNDAKPNFEPTQING
jgi:hypothetical protein